MNLPLSIRSEIASPIAMLTRRMERPECDPPPTVTRSVSFATKRIEPIGTPNQSLATWA